MVCRSCGIDYSPPKPVAETSEPADAAEESPSIKSDDEEDSEDLNLTNLVLPFHLAFPVDDLPKARKFYTEVLGCTTGREAESCVFNFYGHQIVAHRFKDA